MLPCFYHKNLCDFIVEEGRSNDGVPLPNPRIVSSDNGSGERLFTAVCDKVTPTITPSLLSAWELYFITFYIFNITYSKTCKHTLEFFQRLFFNIQDGSSKTGVAHNLILKLNREARMSKN